jgi:hypothetical protein
MLDTVIRPLIRWLPTLVWKLFLPAFLIFGIAVVWRMSGLRAQSPFWVDEFSTGTSARMILQQGIKIFWERPPNSDCISALKPHFALQ